VRSALRNNPNAQVILWHEPKLDPNARVQRLISDGVQLRALDSKHLFKQVLKATSDPELERAIERVQRIYGALSSPAARSNIVRLLLLFVEGGIYLDTDTLTLKSLDGLRNAPAFCGLEHILWSKRRLNKLSAYYWTLGPLLSLLRLGSAHLKPGYRVQKALLRWYDSAANNAVLGFSPGHAFLRDLFLRMAALPEQEWTKRYRLGTHLLQEQLAASRGSPHPTIEYAPDYFYPIGPVVSAHYFHDRSQPKRAARELVPAAAHVLHWYASVSDLEPMDEEHILAHRDRTIFAHLCADFVE
jgi:hypothetical protein